MLFQPSFRMTWNSENRALFMASIQATASSCEFDASQPLKPQSLHPTTYIAPLSVISKVLATFTSTTFAEIGPMPLQRNQSTFSTLSVSTAEPHDLFCGLLNRNAIASTDGPHASGICNVIRHLAGLRCLAPIQPWPGP